MDLMEAKYKDIRQRLFAIQLALEKSRKFENKEYLLKGYNSVSHFVVDEKILIRANLLRMYLGMIMMVEPCTRWKKGSLIYWGRRRVGKRLFNKAIKELERQLKE